MPKLHTINQLDIFGPENPLMDPYLFLSIVTLQHNNNLLPKVSATYDISQRNLKTGLSIIEDYFNDTEHAK